MSSRELPQPDRPVRVTDLLIRQRLEALIEYAYISLRQFPQHERHVLSAEIRQQLWLLLHTTIQAHKRYHKRTLLGRFAFARGEVRT